MFEVVGYYLTLYGNVEIVGNTLIMGVIVYTLIMGVIVWLYMVLCNCLTCLEASKQ